MRQGTCAGQRRARVAAAGTGQWPLCRVWASRVQQSMQTLQGSRQRLAVAAARACGASARAATPGLAALGDPPLFLRLSVGGPPRGYQIDL